MTGLSDQLGADSALRAARMRDEADVIDRIGQLVALLPGEALQAGLTDLLALTIARAHAPSEWVRAQDDVRRQLHYSLLALGVTKARP